MSDTRNIADILSKDEMKAYRAISDVRGFLGVATSWAIIISIFVIVGVFPHPITFLIGLVLLGGRHLALAILAHEASHRTLFRNRKANDFVGTWLCAVPVWLDLERYRVNHLQHHAHTWTEKDPDVSLADKFPVTWRSMLRKFGRDIIGVAGLKRIYGLLLMDLGFIEYTTSASVVPIDQEGRTPLDVFKTGVKHLWRFTLLQVIAATILFWADLLWVYGFWWLAWLTTYSVIFRVRSIAEHAVIPDPEDPFYNTRTTHASWWERLTFAPHRVNYHLEHHLLMTVPFYRLPDLHARLQSAGVIDEGNTATGYWRVVKKAMEYGA